MEFASCFQVLFTALLRGADSTSANVIKKLRPVPFWKRSFDRCQHGPYRPSGIDRLVRETRDRKSAESWTLHNRQETRIPESECL